MALAEARSDDGDNGNVKVAISELFGPGERIDSWYSAGRSVGTVLVKNIGILLQLNQHARQGCCTVEAVI
jgi:hypothetical protein